MQGPNPMGKKLVGLWWNVARACMETEEKKRRKEEKNSITIKPSRIKSNMSHGEVASLLWIGKDHGNGFYQP